MKKKVLAALMCAAMTVGMLAGCGGNSTAGNAGAGEAASGTESADSGAGRREMDVEGDDVGTGLSKGLDLRLGMLDHQVHVKDGIR